MINQLNVCAFRGEKVAIMAGSKIPDIKESP